MLDPLRLGPFRVRLRIITFGEAGDLLGVEDDVVFQERDRWRSRQTPARPSMSSPFRKPVRVRRGFAGRYRRARYGAAEWWLSARGR
jgi:hypothetical protein